MQFVQNFTARSMRKAWRYQMFPLGKYMRVCKVCVGFREHAFSSPAPESQLCWKVVHTAVQLVCFHPNAFHLLSKQHSEENFCWSQFTSLCSFKCLNCSPLHLNSNLNFFIMPCVHGTCLFSSFSPTLILAHSCSHTGLPYVLRMHWGLFHLKTFVPALAFAEDAPLLAFCATNFFSFSSCFSLNATSTEKPLLSLLSTSLLLLYNVPRSFVSFLTGAYYNL